MSVNRVYHYGDLNHLKSPNILKRKRFQECWCPGEDWRRDCGKH